MNAHPKQEKLLITFLKSENRKLHRTIAKLSAENISMKNEVFALKKEAKKGKKIILSWKESAPNEKRV